MPCQKSTCSSQKIPLDMQEADDMMQECFIRLLTDGQIWKQRNFEAWMYRVCKYHLANHQSKKNPILFPTSWIHSGCTLMIPMEDLKKSPWITPKQLWMDCQKVIKIFLSFCNGRVSQNRWLGPWKLQRGYFDHNCTKQKNYLRQFIHQHKINFMRKSEFFDTKQWGDFTTCDSPYPYDMDTPSGQNCMHHLTKQRKK